MTQRQAVLSLLLLLTATNAAVEDSFQWRPEEVHPCTVDRMTMDQVWEKFGEEGIPPLYDKPLVITTTSPTNSVTRQRVQEDAILSNFPSDFNVTLSSSNSFSEHRRTVPLQTYLEEMKQNNGVTSPHQLSNESWYLFGETFGPEWKHMLRDYRLPPCETCRSEYVALSFGIGNRGSGVQWHIHGPGFSEALVGRKHWVLYPPYYPPPFFHHDQSTRNWIETIYTNITKLTLSALEQLKDHPDDRHLLAISRNAGRPFECTLEPGDLIYFPDRWYHATLNCDFYTAFVSSFTSDFDYLRDRESSCKTEGCLRKEESKLPFSTNNER